MIEAIRSYAEARWPSCGGVGRSSGAIVVSSDRAPSAKVTYLLFDGTGRPAIVAKAAREASGECALLAEFRVLRRLRSRDSPSVTDHVPLPLSLDRVSGRTVLFMTAVSGEPMTRRYYTPGHTKTLRRVERDFEAAGGWLRRFQDETRCGSAGLDQATLRRWVQRTFDRYRAEIGWGDDEQSLLDAILERAADLTGLPISLSGAHGDYWMGNLMVEDGQVTGVVDWERGRLAGLPFSDIYKFPTSYGFYLDRAYPGREGHVPGHPGRGEDADRWRRFGPWPNLPGFAYSYFGTGWFPGLIREYVTQRLRDLDIPEAANAVFFPTFLADQATALDVLEFRSGYRSLLRALWAERDGTWIWNEALGRRSGGEPDTGSTERGGGEIGERGRTASDGGIGPGVARRVLDVALSCTALLILSPLLLLLILAVRASGGGPAIFRQVRVGQGGRPFSLYKLRTLRAGGQGPEVTAPHDPRMTRVGRILRVTGLDELPQLVNVMRGDMTLVGPRPETVLLAARYPAACSAIFRFRPGLTGPAQIRLRDADVIPPGVPDVEDYYLRFTVPRRVALDLEYLARPTLFRTLALLISTGAFVLRTTFTRSARRPGAGSSFAWGPGRA